MAEAQLISISVIVGLVSLYLIISIMKKGLRQTAIDLIVQAEKSFGEGQGAEKMNTVIAGILTASKLPIPVSVVRWFVQKVFDEIKEALDYKPEEKGE